MKKQIEMHCPKCGSANILTDDLECLSCGNSWHLGTNSPHVKKRGGKRKGAGAKKQEPKKAIGQRVPTRFHKQLVQVVKTELQKLLNLEASQNGL